jgi:hypothetical protein
MREQSSTLVSAVCGAGSTLGRRCRPRELLTHVRELVAAFALVTAVRAACSVFAATSTPCRCRNAPYSRRRDLADLVLRVHRARLLGVDLVGDVLEGSVGYSSWSAP